MDERPKRPRPDDVPIIGDYSAEQNARLGATGQRAAGRGSAPAGGPAGNDRAGATVPRRVDDRITIDPRDARRYRKLAERKTSGPGAKIRRFAPLAFLVVVAAFVGWNFDTLRQMRVEFNLPSWPGRSSTDGSGPASGDSGTVDVAAPVVVGGEAEIDPTKDPNAPRTAAPAEQLSDDIAAANPFAPAQRGAANEDAARESAAADAASRTDGEAAAAATPTPAPPPAPEPEAPVEPERFQFGLNAYTVSESEPAAAVLVLRSGGRRAATSITWWTTRGTATPGVDYADLGRVELQFPAGAQNRTIRVPLVGDRVVEGPETFFLHFTTSSGPEAEHTAEVTIIDDD